MISFIFHFLLFILLTVITQIGGIIYLCALFLIKRKKKQYRLKRITLFLGLYLLTTYLILPLMAPIFGRQKIENGNRIDSHFFATELMNRNYVSKEMHATLQEIAHQFHEKNPTTKLIYLDANFPFFDGFPLLPHLSHNDGKKIDLSFIYKDQDGKPTNKKPSNSGYGVFENPRSGETHQTQVCKETGAWQYDYSKYLTFGSSNEFTVDSSKTRNLIQIIVQHPKVQKVFLEPHLKQRWNLSSNKIRFQGCKSVRHDDHIHLQIK